MINLEKIIRDIPKQLTQKLGIVNGEKIVKNPSSVVVCGMGGSGVIGDLLQSLFPTIDIHVHKNYGLPKNADLDSLFIIISYSGDTEEILSSFDEVQQNKYNIAVITGGGKLLKRAKENQIAFVQVPQGQQTPTRFNTGILTRAALEIFEVSGLIPNLDNYVSSIEQVKEISNAVSAERFLDKTVLIYTSPELRGLGEVWKEALNETAKLPAFVNTVPEVSHNEIESIGTMKNPLLVFLRDPQSKEKIRESFSSLEKIAKEKEWDYQNVILEHQERIVDLVKSMMIALETSFNIAKLKGVDPIKTPLLEKQKNN